jgi:hypothetical protein
MFCAVEIRNVLCLVTEILLLFILISFPQKLNILSKWFQGAQKKIILNIFVVSSKSVEKYWNFD